MTSHAPFGIFRRGIDKGNRGPWRRLVLLLAIGALAYGGYLGFWRYHLKRFQVVGAGTLYRVAQPTELGLRHAVEHYGIRTVVSLQLFDFRLHKGLFDFGEPEGMKESEFVESLGATAVQWPMGDESIWPWPDPWELAEFFRVIDDPAKRPVLIHCMGGRHRTGTFSALYRLEYDRWTADAALDEMYSFSFGHAIPVQEINLRTYQPRPLPTPESWPTVAAVFHIDAAESPAEAMPTLVHRIQQAGADDPLRRDFAAFVESDHAFALSLASRVFDDVNDTDDPALTKILPRAREVIRSRNGDAATTSAAAALLADFGSPADRTMLLDALRAESQTPAPTPFYDALCCGVVNRYTANRLLFMQPLLEDLRKSLSSGGRYSYAATAVGRVAAITDELPVPQWYEPNYDVEGRASALAWLQANPDVVQVASLASPRGRRDVLEGDGPLEEDLSRMKR